MCHFGIDAVTSKELEVLSLSHLYSLETNDIMRFSVLGFISEIWIELQAPVVTCTSLALNLPVGRCYLSHRQPEPTHMYNAK